MSVIKTLIISSLINLDNVSLFQFLISRPSFTGLVVGYLNNTVMEGFILGVLIEFLFLDFVPIGGVPLPNPSISTTISILILPYYNGEIYIPFFIGILVGEVYSYIEAFTKSFKVIFSKMIERRFMNYNFFVSDVILYSLAIDVIVYIIYGFVMFKIFSFLSFYLNTLYLKNVFRIAMVGSVFISLSSLFFKFKTQVGKNE
jgi:mannose/fructose/N-acetylgalactosamine-specific phosphotransferase system component IIC